MDELKFVISWQGGSSLGADTVVKVTGIQLEGATFDGQSLRDCVHSSPTISAVPAADIAWILQVQNVLRRSVPKHTYCGDKRFLVQNNM